MLILLDSCEYATEAFRRRDIRLALGGVVTRRRHVNERRFSPTTIRLDNPKRLKNGILSLISSTNEHVGDSRELPGRSPRRLS